MRVPTSMYQTLDVALRPLLAMLMVQMTHCSWLRRLSLSKLRRHSSNNSRTYFHGKAKKVRIMATRCRSRARWTRSPSILGTPLVRLKWATWTSWSRRIGTLRSQPAHVKWRKASWSSRMRRRWTLIHLMMRFRSYQSIWAKVTPTEIVWRHQRAMRWSLKIRPRVTSKIQLKPQHR